MKSPLRILCVLCGYMGATPMVNRKERKERGVNRRDRFVIRKVANEHKTKAPGEGAFVFIDKFYMRPK